MSTELDVNSMMSDAIMAAENTGEKDPALVGKNGKIAKEPIKDAQPQEIEDVMEDVLNAKTPGPIEKEIQAEPIKKVNIEPDKEKQVIVNKEKPSLLDSTKIINVESIEGIIKMKEVLDSYTDKEKDFIKQYFQQEFGSPSDIIYSALTTDKRDLEAIDRIVIARENNSAERAFYLMELSNNDIKDIYEQINLFSGQLDELDNVTDNNKIRICRLLENIISQMDNNVFVYISKLQEFTSKSLF